MDPVVASTVLELKRDLKSPEVMAIVEYIYSLKWPSFPSQDYSVDTRIDLLQFSLLVYRFCELLISLLEARTIIEGTSSDEAISTAVAAMALKHLVQPDWFRPPEFSHTLLFPRAVAYWFMLRILWTTGLCLGTRKYLHGALLQISSS